MSVKERWVSLGFLSIIVLLIATRKDTQSNNFSDDMYRRYDETTNISPIHRIESAQY